MDFGAMSDEGLIDALRAAHGAAARAQAAEVFAVRELYRRHRAESVEPGPGGVRAGEFAASEVAVAVHADEATAGALIDIGLALEESLPRTRLAFEAGRIDLAKVRVIVDSTRGLSREVAGVVETRLIEVAERTEPARLRQAARRWAARLDPLGAQRRRERRQDQRDVRIRAVQDSMAVFDGLLPAPGAQTVAMRLREMSLQVCGQDPRTMPQRRADALVALADGSGRLRCTCGRGRRCANSVVPQQTPRRPLVQIGIPAESLLGTSEAPAFLAGYGPIDAALARTVAEHARFEVISEREESEDGGGRETSARWVRAVDGICRFPGCVVPAAESEPVDGPAEEAGRAAGAGSYVLCARHHRLKVLADKGKTRWCVAPADHDRLRWTAPTGGVHITVREGARYLFPHTDIDRPVGVRTGAEQSEPDSRPLPSDRPTAVDLVFPVAGHLPVHLQLTRIAPEDEIPVTERSADAY